MAESVDAADLKSADRKVVRVRVPFWAPVFSQLSGSISGNHIMSEAKPMSILFADVSGSTRLFEERGDVEARQIISAVLDALTGITATHGGRVVKTIGDEVMCVFPSPVQAALSACDMQRRMSTDPEFKRDNIGIRIGLHHGDVLEESQDVFGDAVNTAARMASIAKREQIVTTASSMRGLTTFSGLKTRNLGRARVSGKLLPIEIVDVLWQEDISNITTVQRAIKLEDGDPGGATLVLRYKGQVAELRCDGAPITFGRDAGSTLVIEAEWVSRHHASIEFKRGHFVLIDRSTNGTFVALSNDDEVRVHREELVLRRGGMFNLGQSTRVAGEHVVHFDIEGA